MNKEDPYRDQAERLRKRISKKQDAEVKSEKESLPPRSRIHQGKKSKQKLKVQYPIIRLLALFFVLLPIMIYSIHQYLDGKKDVAEKTGTNQSGYDTVVEIKESDRNKGTKIEVHEEDQKTTEETPKDDQSEQQEENTDDEVPVDDASKEQNTDEEGKTNIQQVQNQQENVKGTSEIYHTVQPSETIYRIAMKYYQSQSGIEFIKKANNLQSNEIRVGQVLHIPKSEK